MRAEADGARFGLARGDALLGGFQAMVAAVAHQVDHGIEQAFDHRLVDFGRFAVGDERDALAGVAGEIMDQAAEPTEQARHRHHAQHHHRVAQFPGEPLDLFGDGAQDEVVTVVGELRQAALRDDEFTDPVHQRVETTRGNANAFLRLGRRTRGGPGIVRRLRHRCGDRLDRRFDRIGRGLDGIIGDERLDMELHIVHDENEGVFDIVAADVASQGDIPADMAVRRHQVGQRRHAVGARDDRAVTQFAQFVEQHQRVGAVRHCVGRQAEAHLPAACAHRGPFGSGCRRGRSGRGGHAAAGCGIDRLLQFGEDRIAIALPRGALDEAAHVILRRQDDPDQGGRRGHLALAHAVESGFAMMGEAGERVEPEHRARTLERVQPAKHGVDEIDVVQPMGQVEQPLLDLVEQLACLHAKGGDRIVAAHLPRTLRATLTS